MSTPFPRTPPRNALIVGLGSTGLSMARYFRRLGVDLAVTDTRDRPPGLEALRREMPDAALFLGGLDPAAFAAAELVALSPGVSMAEPAVRAALDAGVPVVGDIELFAREAAAPVAAVTGSNGKSTVTSLVAEMARRSGLRVAAGGNLGEPALDLLDPGVELYVLELSSFQLETTRSLQARAAAVLNLSPDHLDRYASMEEYAAAKARILDGALCGVLNRDDPRVAPLAEGLPEHLFFTLDEPRNGEFGVRDRDGEPWLCRGADPLMPASEVRMRGRHNRANALAGMALAAALGLPAGAVLDTLRGFPGLPHRTELVLERDGVRWINDSKATNPGACLAALEGLVPGDGDAARAVLILGGDCKGADFSELRAPVQRLARAAVLMGRDAPAIEGVLESAVPLVRADSMHDAVKRAAELARPGDLVLLSPACASLDMFESYEHRGRAFVEAVRSMTP